MPGLKEGKRFYPVGLNISGKDCLVVGGGRVAERKIKRLLEYGARVQVVSPALTPSLTKWVARKFLKYREGRFHPFHLKKQALVFAATGDPALNRKVVRLAHKKGIWANSAMPGAVSDFVLPALVKRRSFNVSVSTDGRSPRRAKKIKERLERLL